MRGDDVTVFQLNAKCGVGQGFGNDAFHLQGFFFCQFIVISVSRLANCAETSALMQGASGHRVIQATIGHTGALFGKLLNYQNDTLKIRCVRVPPTGAARGPFLSGQIIGNRAPFGRPVGEPGIRLAGAIQDGRESGSRDQCGAKTNQVWRLHLAIENLKIVGDQVLA